MTRCTSCGRLPTETHCEICHRAVRAIARLAYAIGYDETGDEMTELLSDGTPGFPGAPVSGIHSGQLSSLAHEETTTSHIPQPCGDNPQPCGCDVCCCPDCQGICVHTGVNTEAIND